MSIWKKPAIPDQLNRLQQNTLSAGLGIEFTRVADDHLIATMPVDHRTIQPMGLLHGGASMVLLETLGSVASNLCIEEPGMAGVGLAIYGNHLKPATSGLVTGICRPVRLGRKIHVWTADIINDEGQLLFQGTLTVSIVSLKPSNQ